MQVHPWRADRRQTDRRQTTTVP